LTPPSTPLSDEHVRGSRFMMLAVVYGMRVSKSVGSDNHYLDLVPKGRDEADGPMSWLRRRDEYAE
jgi:predicted dithiol-disulfide oxidoreductase (DUF899 family)